jgi:hypothetical protein
MTPAHGLPRMPVMKPHSGFARRLVLAAALTCLALPAQPQAAAAAYTVEIVVFRNGGDSAALADSDSKVSLLGADVAATAVTSRKLGGSIARLNGAGMRVLGHAAWRQAPAAHRSRRGVSTAGLGLPGITGKVILEREKLLHLGLDLVVEDGGKRYRIDEVRSVKADEVQYFDHPAIGVLAIVSGD